MIRGFYTAVSGLIANTNRQAVVADNIANVSTPGFKESRTSQSDFELELARSAGGRLGSLATAARPLGPFLDRTAGPVETTGVPTDLAIDGDGLFVVRSATGIAYTRAGNFVLDASGTLSTQAGEPVLGTDGRPIVVAAGASTFTVGTDGTVDGSKQRIAVVAWPQGGLVRRGGTLMASPGGSGALPGQAVGATVRQGSLERSNVDLATAMTELIGYQRSLGLNARALTIQDETLGEAIQLGRLH
jgi:flagellar basal body rod protein FlgG